MAMNVFGSTSTYTCRVLEYVKRIQAVAETVGSSRGNKGKDMKKGQHASLILVLVSFN